MRGSKELMMAGWLDGFEATTFKKVAGGFVFAAPRYWPFARPRRYLVNDAQKEQIAACIRQTRRVVLPLAFLFFVLIMVFAISLAWSRVANFWTFFAALWAMLVPLVAAGLSIQFYTARKLEPVLAGLPLTDQRISHLDRIKALARTVSFGRLLLMAFLLTMLSLVNVYNAQHSTGSDPTDLFSERARFFAFLVGAIALGLLAAYYFYLAILKAKLERAAS